MERDPTATSLVRQHVQCQKAGCPWTATNCLESLGLAVTQETDPPACHDEISENCRTPGIFTWFHEDGITPREQLSSLVG